MKTNNTVEGAPRIWAAIEHAASHPKVFQQARKNFQDVAPNLFAPHEVELSASAAGACVLERWAYLHGELALPDDYQQSVVKRDGGTLYGAWIAALFAAGYEDLTLDKVMVEVVGNHEGIPAHVEIVILSHKFVDLPADYFDDLGDGWQQRFAGVKGEMHETSWVIEIKTSFFGGEFSGSREYHILQAAKEALCVGAPGFSVLNVLPAATRRGGTSVKPRHFVQDDFRTADYLEAVKTEYTRLEAAKRDLAPIGDAKEAWRCASCQYSACERNPRTRIPMAVAK